MENEGLIRISIFLSLFIAFAIIEAAIPRKQRHLGRGWRWITNWSLVLIDSLVLRLLVPLAAIGVAIWAENTQFGLSYWLNSPYWLSFLGCFFLLDLAIYFQHVLSHKIPLLWRFHKVHHSDIDLDVSSALRFHPIEIVLSMLYKMGLVALLGVPVLTVLWFEIVLNGAAMFNHANINLPPWLDKALRRIIVTPDMHRVHHSIYSEESNKNYGFNFVFWDRLFKTYQKEPKDGHENMKLGLLEAQNTKPSRPLWTILLPFK